MGPGAEPRVLAQGPVLHVVAAGPAGPGKIGDLVLLIPQGPQPLHRPQVHIRLGVVVRQVHLLLHVPQGGALLHLQPVAAQVLRLQGRRPLQGVPPPRQVLAGQAVDEIQGEAFDPGPPGRGCGLLRLGEGVGPAQRAQHTVVRRLHPQGQPVHPGPAQGAEGPPVPGAVRVGLQGDLRVPGQAVVLFYGFEDLPQPLLPQIGRGAAAQVHAVHGVGGGPLGDLRQLAAEGGDVAVHPVLGPGQGVEVAVDALALAEGDVDIQAQGLDGLFHVRSPRWLMSPPL